MKWETKDKLLKTGFVCAIILMIVGIGLSFHECQRDVVKKNWYGEQSSKSAVEQECPCINDCR